MSIKDEINWVVGVYRIRDPIKNFKIKVRLHHEKSTFIPVPNFDDGQVNEISPEADSTYEEHTFSWQEKVFSPYEREYYKTLNNCHSPLEKQYNEEIKNLLKKETKFGRLFSYTDADNYLENINDNILNIPITKQFLTPQEQHISAIMAVGSGGLGLSNNDQNWSIVDYYPSKDKQNRSRTLRGSGRRFFIMADLSDETTTTTTTTTTSLLGKLGRKEICLCSLRFDPRNGLLHASPAIDSTYAKEPRRIEIDADTKSAYLYWIEHLEQSLNINTNILQETLLRKPSQQKALISTDKTPISLSFASPSHKTVMLLLEIKSFQGIEDENIFIRYKLDTQTGWNLIGEKSGTTQTCYTGIKGASHYSMAFEIQLESTESLTLKSELNVLFEIISVGWWKRQRVVGYCALRIPFEAGMKNHLLQTWRLDEASLSRTSQLRRYFIGGDGQLEDLRYIDSYNTETNELFSSKLSKLGLRTRQGDGVLHVNTSIIIQGKKNESNEHPRHDLFDSPKLIAKVEGVVEAFKRARERMLNSSNRLGIATLQSEAYLQTT